MAARILGIGNPFFDRTIHTENLPEGLTRGDTSIVLDKSQAEKTWNLVNQASSPSEWSLGGSCTNVIKSLAHLGNSCSLLGKIGKDRKDEIEARLKQIGIGSLLSLGKADAGFVNCFVTDGDRTMQAYLGASAELSHEDLLPDHFKNFSHVHLEGYLAYFDQVLDKGIQLACDNYTTISLSLSSMDTAKAYKLKFLDCARRVDYLFGNFLEMKALMDEQEISKMKDLTDEQAISSIISKIDAPFTTIVITDGANGCWVKPSHSTTAKKYDAIPIDKDRIKDTTGAGDFFLAGFLHGRTLNKNYNTCVKIANLAASYVIQQKGTDLPNEQWKNLKNSILEITEV